MEDEAVSAKMQGRLVTAYIFFTEQMRHLPDYVWAQPVIS